MGRETPIWVYSKRRYELGRPQCGQMLPERLDEVATPETTSSAVYLAESIRRDREVAHISRSSWGRTYPDISKSNNSRVFPGRKSVVHSSENNRSPHRAGYFEEEDKC